jgi:hypothetical protein
MKISAHVTVCRSTSCRAASGLEMGVPNEQLRQLVRACRKPCSYSSLLSGGGQSFSDTRRQSARLLRVSPETCRLCGRAMRSFAQPDASPWAMGRRASGRHTRHSQMPPLHGQLRSPRRPKVARRKRREFPGIPTPSGRRASACPASNTARVDERALAPKASHRSRSGLRCAALGGV